MYLNHVHLEHDVHCDGWSDPPVYRLWVNSELFAERTWRWTDCFLQEEIVISAPPGFYTIRYELIGQGTLRVENPRLLSGPGQFINQDTLRIE